MARLNRRDFLKALGLGGGVSALSACGLDDNRYATPIEQYLPYVVKNDVHTPGTPTFFATTVTSGPAAFPVTARHRDGRVVNVGANFRAPPDPAVPTAALLSLQRLYSPDRFPGPRQRDGASWADIDWATGLQRLATEVAAARDAGKKVAYLGPYRSGSIVKLLRDFTGGNAVFWEPLGPDAEATAAEVLFGTRMLPAYDLTTAHYVLSFGAEFLSGTWGNTTLAAQYARARNPNEGHFITRFALVSPYQDQTGANADDWYQAEPGSQALVARAVAKLVALKAGYSGPLMAFLDSARPAEAAAEAGISPTDLDAIASQFAEASRQGGAVALPGGVIGNNAAAVDIAIATYLMNLVAGNGGRTFGIGPHYAGPIDGYGRVAGLLEQMRAGDVGVLLLDDSNPAYSLPADAGVAEALAAVGFVCALSGHPDETNASAHLMLPTHHPLEDWGDEEPVAGVYLLRQPGMQPLHDTRSLGDILLQTARTAGLTPPAEVAAVEEDEQEPPDEGEEGDEPTEAAAPLGFEPETFRDYVAARWQREVKPAHAMGSDFPFADWWRLALTDGFVRLDSHAVTGVSFALHEPTVVAEGHGWAKRPQPAGDGAFHLLAIAHPIRQDGRFANEPWAQEVGDPITGETWDTWLELSPEAASRLGVGDNELVEVKTAFGAVAIGVHVRPGLRDDVAALAFGQGHSALGRYAAFGANVVGLLSAAASGPGGLAWQQARASLTATGSPADLAPTLGSTALKGRQLAPLVSAEALEEHGDEPVDHPGELTGIHHAVFDERLHELGIEDFYQPPDHPVHRWALTVDNNACTGCGACVIACYAENNLPVVGKRLVQRGKEMNWLRINRYWEANEHGLPAAQFVPLMCQQCTRAPCESVCPVIATYHNHEGLNAMVYNRCVGTRYCANNCPYQVRRFNFHSYVWPEPFQLQLNPDVMVRTMGVMEKCTFCVQRTRQVKSALKDQGHSGPVPDEHLRQLTACAEACPSQALTFGNLKDEASVPHQTRQSARTYLMLEELNTEPGVNYLARASWNVSPQAAHHAPADATPADADHGEPAPHGTGGH